MKHTFYILACVVVPIAWGAIVHLVFHHGGARFVRRRAAASAMLDEEEFADRNMP